MKCVLVIELVFVVGLKGKPMSNVDLPSISISTRTKPRWNALWASLMDRESENDSMSDVRALGKEWIKLAAFDFMALGLGSDHPDLLIGDSAHRTQINESMWKIGKLIVDKKDNPRTGPATEALFDAIMLERVVLHFLPSEALKMRSEAIKKRFQTTVGKEKYESYFPVATSDKTIQSEELRADLDFILTETMYVYMLTPLRPLARGRLLWYCMKPFLMISSVMLCTSLAIAYKDQKMDQFATMALIPVFGAMGAMLSLQQRVENLPSKGDTVRSILAMESGRETLWTTSIAGAFFAIIMNLIFAGGMIEGNLFPSFKYLNDAGGLLPVPRPISDIAKMLIWAFVAGFAERLVPDTITRLTMVLKSSDFGMNSTIPGRKLQDGDGENKADPSGQGDDIYSGIMKAQSDRLAKSTSPKPSAPDLDINAPTEPVPAIIKP